MLPLAPKEKRPLTKHGLLDASTNIDQVVAWWTSNPDANIGLRTGVAFDVLDLDGPDSFRSLHELAPGYKHEGPVSQTGKGYHLLFQVTTGRNFARKHPGVDFRGQSGYIVAPPSIHPLGHRYTWMRSSELALPEPPQWLLDLVIPPPPPPAKPKSALVYAATQSLDLISELQSIGAQFRSLGNRLVSKCPFHADDTPSLVVYNRDNFFCFGCNAWGDALNVRKYKRDGVLR